MDPGPGAELVGDAPAGETVAAVKPLPKSDQALVLRTDFSDEAAWHAIRSAIEAPVRGFPSN